MIYRLQYQIALFSLCLFGSLLATPAVLALGPIGALGTQATVYAPNRFPMAYQTDQGGLGAFNNQQATAIADFAFSEWANLSTATLSFTNSGQIDHDVTSATDPLITGIEQFFDGVFPVVFDNNGAITDNRIGAGASNQVYGFASSFSSDGITYQEGLVVINGKLTAQDNVEPVYREVIAHEVRHMLGIGHSQVALSADFSLMYPTTLTGVNNLGIDPDDAASMSLLYPAPGYLASVGAISGTITDANGSPLSGVNVVAVNTVTGAAFSTVSDYYSGGDPLYRNGPDRTGAYTINGLPPGSYYVRAEPINVLFQGGSRVASYLTPVNTDLWREWYNGGGENGNILVDNAHDKTAVNVTAGNTTTGITIASGYSPTITELTAFSGTIGQVIDLPLQFSNATLTKLATRYTAPSNGSLLGVRIYSGEDSQMPTDGGLKVTVYKNTQGSLAGVPGDTLGSVTIPFAEINAGHENDFWLRGIGQPINFLQGQEFHVGVEVVQNGRVVFFMDNASGTKNQTSYFVQQAQQWLNFPDGLTGAAGWNIQMRALYTTVSAGVPTPLIGLTPSQVAFSPSRIGAKVTEELEVRNVGTADLNVTNLLISGSNGDKFSIESGGGTFSLQPGQARTLVIGFSPAARPQVSAILNIFHNGEGSPTAVTLAGSGKEAIISSVPSSLNFADQPINRTREEQFAVLQNAGNDSLMIVKAEGIGPDASSFVLLNYTPRPWVGLLQIFRANILFRPNEERSYSATLRVEHNLPSSPLEIPIVGTGTEAVSGVAEIRSGDLHLKLLGSMPNPVGGKGEIVWEVAGEGRLSAELQIVDAAGRIITREHQIVNGTGGTTTSSFPFDFSTLSPGLYQIVLHSEQGSAVQRVIVVR